jgi:hypothetical protein
MLPEEEMNRGFRDKQGQAAALIPLGEAMPARLTIGTVGQFDTLAFSREAPDFSPLKPGTVEIEVKSVGLNAKVRTRLLISSSPYFLIISNILRPELLRPCWEGQHKRSRV